MASGLFALLALSVAATSARASDPTWCGKYYQQQDPVVPPDGQFPTPSTSSSPLLAFRCAPAIRPYIAEDASSTGIFIFDTPITYSHINGASPISLPSGGGGSSSLDVTIEVNGKKIGSGSIPLNASRYELDFDFSSLSPTSSGPYEATCSASYSSGGGHSSSYSTTAELLYLPNPTKGSVTKMDMRTGAMMAKPANGSDGPYEYVFPIGYYTNFDGFLSGNRSAVSYIKSLGFNLVHPIPTFDNTTALIEVLDWLQEAGLYLMYDFRYSYQNSSSVQEQIAIVQNYSNVLLWYTADEPDGTSDPLNATSLAREEILTLDGYRHPVSVCLNCQNYFWSNYSAGADIVMQDTYMVGNNVTWSLEWDTECTVDFGCCGCDNCQGAFEDISNRMDNFTYRLNANGWERTKAVWTVPQAFGDSQYWTRYPTGKEYVVQAVMGINHGAHGVVAWNMPTPNDIAASSSLLANALPHMTSHMLDPSATFTHVFLSGLDVGVWALSKSSNNSGGTTSLSALILATNTNYANVSYPLSSILNPALAAAGLSNSSLSAAGGSSSNNSNVNTQISQVLNSGASASGTSGLSFQSVGTGAWIVEVSSASSSSSSGGGTNGKESSGSSTSYRFVAITTTTAVTTIGAPLAVSFFVLLLSSFVSGVY